MRLVGLSWKNATIKWWRSLTLGFFIFTVSFVMILSSSFILAAKNKVEQVILKGITGHVQIRSEQSMEGDMVTQYGQGWDSLKPIAASTASGVEEILRRKFPGVESVSMIRQNAYLTSEDQREETMLIGIDPAFSKYKEAFLLTGGRYLDPHGTNEILLTEEQAAKFGAGIGDSIRVTTKNRYGLNSAADLKVVGIGNYIMLSLFSYKANYTHSSVVKKLVEMQEGEMTDIILFLSDRNKSGDFIQDLSGELKSVGIKAAITKDEILESEDLEVKDLDFEEEGKVEGIQISSFDEMGESFKGISATMFMLLHILVLFLFAIVSILIVNLVYMMGLERYHEVGTLRAIGFSRFQVIRIFMGEILMVSLLSALLGVAFSAGLVWVLGSAGIASPIPALDFIMGKTLSLTIDPVNILTDLGIITGFTLAASFYPAYKACSIDPAQTIRTV